MHQLALPLLASLPTWGLAAVDLVLRGTVLLLLAGAAALALRRASAAARHLVWASALTGLLVLPVLSRILPAVPLGIVPAAWLTPDAGAARAGATLPAAAAAAMPLVGKRARPEDAPRATVLPDDPSRARMAAPPAVHDAALAVPPPTSVAVARPASLVGWAAVAWLLGCVVVLLRLLAGHAGVARLARRATPVADAALRTRAEVLAQRLGIVRPVTILSVPGEVVPMTWGLLRPVILLPGDAPAWDGERQRMVLLHELAHIRRLDALWQRVAGVAVALHWFNPLVWIAARRLRAERERACDDRVLAVGTRASAYATGLVHVAQVLGTTRSPAFAALCMARRSDFEGRLRAILDPRCSRRAVGRRGTAAIAVLAALCVLPLAALRPGVAGLHAAVTPSTAPASVSLARQAAPPPVAVARPVSVARGGGSSASPGDATAGRTAAAVLPPSPPAAPGPPAIPSAAVASPAVTAVARDRAGPVDLATLIAVTRSAATISSDYEKASLLTEVADRFLPDDSLRAAYLSAAATIGSGYERQRALTALLAHDPLSDATIVRFIDVVGGIDSDQAKARLLSAVASRPGLGRPALLAVLGAVRAMASDADRAGVLLTIAAGRGLDDPEVRRAFLTTARTLSSDYYYRRVMDAVAGRT